MVEEKIMHEDMLCAQQDCTLCMACVNVCPNKAIHLSTDENSYEKLEINQDECVNCGLCSKVCKSRDMVTRNTPVSCFAAQATDKIKLRFSASGGAFQMLAQYVLKSGGVCYGSEGKLVSGQYTACHVRIDSIEDLPRILNSKYVPSLNYDTYRQAKSDLDKGRFVLFCGTPCQIQGLKAFLGKDYETLLTVDLICHGVTSAQMFNDYLDEIEKRESVTIVDYLFRDKTISWGTNFCYSYFKNNDSAKRIRVKHCPREASSYMIHYLKGDIFRENCYQCSLSCEERVSDFTLGDYWEIETEHPEFVTKSKPPIVLRQGVSCILANTQKAKDFVQNISSSLILHEVTLESIAVHNDNLIKSSKRGKGRDSLLQTYREYGYSAIEKQYRQKVAKRALIYNIKNTLKSHLPDRVRILIYKTPFLRRIVFH